MVSSTAAARWSNVSFREVCGANLLLLRLSDFFRADSKSLPAQSRLLSNTRLLPSDQELWGSRFWLLPAFQAANAGAAKPPIAPSPGKES